MHAYLQYFEFNFIDRFLLMHAALQLQYMHAVASNQSLGTRQLCSKFYLLCYAALLKNFAYYAQIMLTEIEQFPNIYFTILMHCLQIFTFISIWNADYKSLLDKYNFIEKIDILY